ncbi:MAG TPA: hypothetical protein VGK78_10680 [Nocardioides sp.]|uniref:hypothetical protein n=1 Tax=Nocardioides sp. TaxID=35761 RepID=UPI002F3EA9E1
MTVRILAAIAVLVSAYVHLYEWLSGMRHVNVIGPLFVVNIVAGVVIAVLLFTWKHWFAPFLAFGMGATTLGGFAIATTSAGLFGDHEKWQGPYIWVAAASEVVAILAGLYATTREIRTSQTSERRERRTVAG